MIHRRFGRTELRMPVLTCGGMRYQQSWSDIDPQALDRKNQENLEACIRRAVSLGLNHIETARGYGSSEYQLGFILPQFPRDSILVQTKISPRDSEAEFLQTFDVSMKYLKLDYVDLLAVHGINTPDLLDQTLRRGTLAACRRLQREGRARHIGFSTHGPLDTILAAVRTGEFDYVNLHWYYFDPYNWEAIAEARRQDMGVFIISPSDKGGKLYEPPERLCRLCNPLTPMGFNDLYCLSHPEVHTLSIGASRPTDFDAHTAILPLLADPAPVLAPIERRIEASLAERLGGDWARNWHRGLPSMVHAPDPVPLYHIVRMYNLAKAHDMIEFARMRYNLLGNGGHWFPGRKADAVDPALLRKALADYPFADRIPGLLAEAHQLFDSAPAQRLSQSKGAE